MSMTESDAKALIEWFKTRKGKTLKLNDNGVDFVIEALEIVQKIKELGDCYIIPKNSTWEVNGIDIHKALEEIQQYRAIGTASDFRELKEKATAKKPIMHPFLKCPTCNRAFLFTPVNYCYNCGTKFDWSEGKE